jgi:hypothetical protein
MLVGLLSLATEDRPPNIVVILAEDVQYYNLDDDPTEANNIAADHPDVVKPMREAIEHFKANVTPGS